MNINPELPLINKGKPNKPDYVPAEHCRVEWGQHLGHKITEIPGLEDTDLQDLNLFTCRGPEHSQPWIKMVDQSSHLCFSSTQNRVLRNFGVRVENSLLEITGRELSAPDITYNGKEQIRPKVGAWPPRAKAPFQTGNLRSWAWIGFGESAFQPQKSVSDGIKELQRNLDRVCGWCPEPEDLPNQRITMAQGIATLSRELERAKVKGAQLVVLILQSRLAAETYNQVKFLGDIPHGIHTCCVLETHFAQANWHYFANVAPKITLKLGGVNHGLFRPHRLFQSASTMVVGYDVTHPTGRPNEVKKASPKRVALANVHKRCLARPKAKPGALKIGQMIPKRSRTSWAHRQRRPEPWAVVVLLLVSDGLTGDDGQHHHRSFRVST